MKLERKIVMAMLGAVLAATLGFGALLLIASEQMEHSLLNIVVLGQADVLSDVITKAPGTPLPQQGLTSAWLTADGNQDGMPAIFSALPLGISHDVLFDNKYYHVLRRNIDDGVLTVAVDISVQEGDEITLQRIAGLGGAGIILLILALARTISHRVAAPLQKLAEELNALQPKSAHPAFFGRYQGAEAEIIAQALDRYVQRLDEMIERERGFSSAVSHELRSPLTVIRSGLELALLDEKLPEQLRPALQRANLNCVQLVQTLDGLMILARDGEPQNMVPINLGEVLNEVCTDIKRTAPASELRLDTQGVLPVSYVPEAHWRILLNNLLRNALQHAPGEPVKIQLSQARLEVIDHGPGIPSDLLPHVFERSRRSVQSAGAGLGLYIAAEICKRYDWRIRALNASEGGCQIIVEFEHGPDFNGQA